MKPNKQFGEEFVIISKRVRNKTIISNKNKVMRNQKTSCVLIVTVYLGHLRDLYI